jgi:phage terminase small subunit
MEIKKENVALMYPDDSEYVKSYMEIIIEDLENQYNGNIPKIMIFSLDLMADLLRVYQKAKREFRGQSVIVTGERSQNGRPYQNPLVQIIQETNKQIINLAEKMGITVFSKQKLKLMKQKTKTDPEEGAKELLEKLLE